MKELNKQQLLEATISFQGKDKCVNIGKDVIRLLGEPQFVSLFLSEDGTNLAISPCEERSPLSFFVPKGFLQSEKTQFRIYSKQFVEGVLFSAGLNTEKTYRLKGTYSAERTAIIFHLSDFIGLAKDKIMVV